MDFHRYGIDERLSRAVEGTSIASNFFEKMLERAVLKNENVCAKISLSEGVEEVCLLPALQWIASAPGGESRRALVLAPDEAAARAAAKAAEGLCAAIGASVLLAVEAPAGAPDQSASLEGEGSAAILVGTTGSLLAASRDGAARLRDYGFLVAIGADRLAEASPEEMRKLSGLLLPSWERRAVLSAPKLSVKAKNLAWDLADNPSEIHIEEEAAKARGVAMETWQVKADAKLRLLLGLVARDAPAALCVFCNLRSTADELAMRLDANGKTADRIVGELAPERKFAMLEEAVSGGGRILVLTDQGAEGLTPKSFPLVVNYDMPLEPEFFVKRLELLDREAAGAKVVNLACERYIYGLTAVEQYIDLKLEPREPEEALLVPDRSAGMEAPRGPREQGRGRGPGRGEDRPRRDEGRREGGRRDEDRRDGGRRREAYGRDDRSPDIRRSISEATGGSLDMDRVGAEGGAPRGGAAPREGSPSPEGAARQRGEQRRRNERRGGGQRPGNQGGGQGGGQRRGQGGKDNRGGRGQQRGQRPGGPDRRVPAPGQGGRGAGNPYDLPMEERMRLYREKYGKRLDEPRPEQGRGRQQGQSGKADRPAGAERSKGAGKRHEGTRPERKPSEDLKREQLPPKVDKPASEEPSAGNLLGRLFGRNKKKQD